MGDAYETAAGPATVAIENEGLELHGLEWPGEDPGVVLLHGGFAHSRWWSRVGSRLAGRVRVLAPDLRGHGDSAWSPERAYAIEDHVRDVARWIEVRQLVRPLVVGHSFGSFVALRFALEHPGALSGLVFADGRARVGETSARQIQFLRLFLPTTQPSLEAAVAAFGLFPRETSATAEMIREVAAESFRQDGDAWRPKFDPEALSRYEPFDLSGRLRSLPAGTVFVRGEHSKVLPAESARAWAAGVPGGRLVEIPGAHHHLPLEAPSRLAEIILETIGTRE